MIVRFALVAAAAASLAACASSGGTANAEMTDAQLAAGDTQQAYARASEAERNRVYCRREYQVGSNRPVRICTSLAQRNRIQQDSEAFTRDAGSRMTPNGGINGNGPAG